MQGPRGGNEEQEGGNRLVGGLVRNRIMQCKEIQSSGIMKEILPKKKKKKKSNREYFKTNSEQTRERDKSRNRRRTIRVMNILTMDSMLRLNLNDAQILIVYHDGVKNISTRPLHRIRSVLNSGTKS